MKRNNKRFNLALLPVLFIIAILPLITFIYFFPEGIYGDYSWFARNQVASDQFTHAKAIVFSIIAVVLFFESAGAFLKLDSIGKKNCLKKIWPFILYAVMIVLSTIFSLDRQYSIHGAFDQMEPFLVLIGYSMLVPYIIMKIDNFDDMKYINYAIVFGTTTISFIGLLQMLGIDIFTLPFMRYLIMTSKMRETVPELSSNGAVYITFGNQNYVGSYVCLMLPMVVSVILYKGPKWLRILAVIDAVGLVTILVGSHSKTGMAILAFVVAVGLIFIGKRVIKKWYIYAPIVIIGIAVFIILNIKRNVYFFDALKNFVVSEKK